MKIYIAIISQIKALWLKTTKVSLIKIPDIFSFQNYSFCSVLLFLFIQTKSNNFFKL